MGKSAFVSHAISRFKSGSSDSATSEKILEVKMSLKVLGIGDNVCDKYLHTAAIYPGGNALNIAVFARELGKESAYLWEWI